MSAATRARDAIVALLVGDPDNGLIDGDAPDFSSGNRTVRDTVLKYIAQGLFGASMATVHMNVASREAVQTVFNVVTFTDSPVRNSDAFTVALPQVQVVEAGDYFVSFAVGFESSGDVEVEVGVFVNGVQQLTAYGISAQGALGIGANFTVSKPEAYLELEASDVVDLRVKRLGDPVDWLPDSTFTIKAQP